MDEPVVCGWAAACGNDDDDDDASKTPTAAAANVDPLHCGRDLLLVLALLGWLGVPPSCSGTGGVIRVIATGAGG